MAGLEKLSAVRVKTAQPPDKGKIRLSDGGGLYFVVRASGSRSWAYIWKANGKRNEAGLGAYPAISLADARELARIARTETAAGRDPRPALFPQSAKTFGEVAAAVVEIKSAGRGDKTARQWERDLIERCDSLARKPIADVTRDDVLKLLRPVWIETPESGRRFRSRLEAVFGYAKSMKWRTDDNPATFKNELEWVLPAHTDTKDHHDAMPWKDVPAFMSELSERKAISARALAFTILTACRTTEVRKAQWSEVDFDAMTWTVPAERMKAKNGKRKPHTVPLSAQALDILHMMGSATVGPFIFPGGKRGKPLSNGGMLRLLQDRMGYDCTVHGFRSSFRDWCGEASDYPRELAELSLAHNIGNAAERAYRRGKAIERRRAVMNDWGAFCVPDIAGGNVVKLHG